MDPTLATILVAFFTAMPPTIAAITALMVSIHNTQKIQELHVSMDGRLSQLLTASLAQGRQNERDDQRNGYSVAPTAPTATPIGTTTTVSTFVPTFTIDK